MSGLEAANLVVGRLGHGERADILPGGCCGATACGAMLCCAVTRRGHAARPRCFTRLAFPNATSNFLSPTHCPTLELAAPSSAVEPDEPHIAAAKELNRSVKGALYAAGMRSPFL